MRAEERHDQFGRPGHGVGDVLREKYRLEEHLAEGGMGLLFRARHLKLERDVAVKLLHPRLASDRETVRRFEREIELAKVLSHPHVAQVHDFGRTEGGTLFIVMEYLEGRDLEKLLAGEGALAVDRACDVALQMLDGLAEAHDHDFVHRDLKPGNIFLSDRRRGGDHVTLLDFGVAKSLDGARHSVTQTGVICGTPMYIPPESLFERDPGKAGDVYAAGLILIETMVGERLIDAGGLADTLELHVCKPTPIPAPLVGTELGEVLVRATSKGAEARFPDAQAMLEALEPAVEAYGGPPELADVPLREQRETLSPRMMERLGETTLDPPEEFEGDLEGDSAAFETTTPEGVGEQHREGAGDGGEEGREGGSETARIDEKGPPAPDTAEEDEGMAGPPEIPLPTWSLVAGLGGLLGSVVAVGLFVFTGGGGGTGAGEADRGDETASEGTEATADRAAAGRRDRGGEEAAAEAVVFGDEAPEASSSDATSDGSRGASPETAPSVRVTTSGEAATVYRDGEKIGRTPRDIELSDGKETVSLRREGFRRRRLTLSEEDTPKLTVELEPSPRTPEGPSGRSGGSNAESGGAETEMRRERSATEGTGGPDETPSGGRANVSAAGGSEEPEPPSDDETTETTEENDEKKFEQIAEDEDFSLE